MDTRMIDTIFNRYFALTELYEALWLSADFETDLEKEFPNQFKDLKYRKFRLSNTDIKRMYDFMLRHPVFD